MWIIITLHAYIIQTTPVIHVAHIWVWSWTIYIELHGPHLLECAYMPIMLLIILFCF